MESGFDPTGPTVPEAVEIWGDEHPQEMKSGVLVLHYILRCLQGIQREPGPPDPLRAQQQHSRDERVLAQDWLLRGGQTSTEKEAEENRPQHDRRAHKLCPPDTHWLWGDGSWPGPVRAGTGTDEVKGTQCQRPQEHVIAAAYQAWRTISITLNARPLSSHPKSKAATAAQPVSNGLFGKPETVPNREQRGSS
ncbi:hypothetical protein J4Q44_G00026180 [Coregonus suidteri]|uniref:Uncharacterized protein n=1 Tax=Coregonus suidteri TaxID=861788 RepID=A0AAN8R7I6_9TELE